MGSYQIPISINSAFGIEMADMVNETTYKKIYDEGQRRTEI